MCGQFLVCTTQNPWGKRASMWPAAPMGHTLRVVWAECWTTLPRILRPTTPRSFCGENSMGRKTTTQKPWGILAITWPTVPRDLSGEYLTGQAVSGLYYPESFRTSKWPGTSRAFMVSFGQQIAGPPAQNPQGGWVRMQQEAARGLWSKGCKG